MTALVSWCFRRAGVVIVLWLVALGTGAAFRDTVDLPAADSTAAANLLRAAGTGGAGERVVVRSPEGRSTAARAGPGPRRSPPGRPPGLSANSPR
ncbi:hypothetical protein AB0F15_11465 [Amycolatopsis sp. NPDC026612]|uniref:hypothetical protein n=1 Tax=Amycolatopsis sp. NPDC026612 TaxID=3155466 RepID=UPI0033DDCDBD